MDVPYCYQAVDTSKILCGKTRFIMDYL